VDDEDAARSLDRHKSRGSDVEAEPVEGILDVSNVPAVPAKEINGCRAAMLQVQLRAASLASSSIVAVASSAAVLIRNEFLLIVRLSWSPGPRLPALPASDFDGKARSTVRVRQRILS
jgi:hypothetical protein